MTEEAIQQAKDAEEHRKSYVAIMKASSEIGVPFALGLTMFFTCLVLGYGFTSLLAGVAVYVAVFVIVKLFFAH